LNLIASDNYPSASVREAVGSILGSRYAEGYPGKRYYSGQKYIDEIEQTAIERAKKVFKANYANVQPHSGSQANQAVYFALLAPEDKILSMRIDQGGHLSHGAAVNFSGQFYNSVFYGVDPETEQINIDEVAKIAEKEKPKMIIAGASSYPRQISFSKFGKIAKSVGAYLMADIAHIAGPVAAGLHPHPFPFCDVVTMTTHKTLRGARGGMILSKNQEIAKKINKAIFPGLQGGPLQNEITGKAVALKEAGEKKFVNYQKQILKNSQAMAEAFKEEGFNLVSGGTDNHLILLNLTEFNITGKEAQEALEQAHLYMNRNVIPNEKRSSWEASGLRVGLPAVTTRGIKEKQSREVAHLIAKVIKNIKNKKAREEVRKEVVRLAKKYPVK
jgi:glycine hydroxymethyltransferase